MKTRTLIAGLALSATTVGGVAAVAAAQSDPSPATTTPNDAPDPAARQARTEFICGHQEEIKDLLTQRQHLISSRLSLLQEARVAAEQAGASQMVARVDERISRTQTEAKRVDTRLDRLTTWAGQHCAG